MKKGFTLIELLAVIIILLLILVIAIPSLLKVLNSSRSKSYEVAIKNIKTAAEYYVTEHPEDFTDYIGDDFILSIDDLCDSGHLDCPIYNPDTEDEINGYVQITRVDDVFEYEYIDGPLPMYVNKPKLASGMTAIKWNGNAWEKVTNPNTDKSWYDYANKQWANAITNDCTDPLNPSTCSMWVWIPRYIYKISSGWNSSAVGTIDIQFSKLTDDNWNSDVIGNIDTGTTASASNNKWTNHPAFKFGGTELTGIWVAKFEASVADTSDACYTSESSTNCNKTTLAPKIVPNSKSWRYITISNIFTVTRNMETNTVYGWRTASNLKTDGTFTTDGNGIDTHLMKNIEWGAVAYLSKSIYGQNTNQIWVNPVDSFTTGCAGDEYNSARTTGCLNTYNTANGVKASTTGNIYGIYDMSEGSWEYTSAYVDNGNSRLTVNGNSIIQAIPQYKDIYTVTTDDKANNYNNAINKKGDAVYETSSAGLSQGDGWYYDFTNMPSTYIPWFVRNSSYRDGRYQGTIFGFGPVAYSTSDNGDANIDYSFHPVLLVYDGL